MSIKALVHLQRLDGHLAICLRPLPLGADLVQRDDHGILRQYVLLDTHPHSEGSGDVYVYQEVEREKGES